MAKVETHLYSIEVDGLFEKVVQFGQLLRAERMDRVPGEKSFGELNLFVGDLGEEQLGVGAEDGPAAQLEALFQQQLAKEKELESLPESFVLRDQGGEETRSLFWRLNPAAWRPESGKLLELRVFPGTSPACFMLATLEFDWNERDAYEAAFDATMGSLEWKPEHMNAAGLEALSKEVYSIFDTMPKARREAILDRYFEVLGKKRGVPRAPAVKPEPLTLDLRRSAGGRIDEAAMRKALEQSNGDFADVRLLVDFLPDPVKLSCYLEDVDPEVVARQATRLANAVAALNTDQHGTAGKYLWENCKMNFEATDYGYGGQTNEDAFGIHGPEDALAQVGPASVYVGDEVDESLPDERFCFALDFYPPWEDEHGCSLAIRGGQIIRWAMPGDSPDQWMDEGI